MSKIARNIFSIFTLNNETQKNNSVVRVSRALVIGALLLAMLVVLSGCPDEAAPSAPANLMITPRNAEVFLSWDEVSGAASYRVYRGEMLIEMTPPLTATTYTDSDLTNGTEYSYTVRAVGSNGVESGNSTAVMATPGVPPDPPSNFNAVAIIGSVELTWNAVTDAESYRVYRDGTLLAMNITAMGAIGFATAAYTDNTVVNGTEYRYTVRAVGSTGVESDASPEMRVTPPATVDFSTLANAGNDSPRGLWSDGTTMWVADDTDGRLYAYKLSDESRDPDKDLTLDQMNALSSGIWANATTMWVVDVTGKIFAYNRSDGSRDASQDFNGLAGDGVSFPTGIWSDGTTMWVLSAGNNTIFAYNLSSKARDSGRDIAAATLRDAGNDKPQGMTGRNGIMWVSDNADGKLYAYNLSDGTYNMARDFNTLAAAGNNLPTHLWASANTMWVVDSDDDRLYAYNLSSKALIQ